MRVLTYFRSYGRPLHTNYLCCSLLSDISTETAAKWWQKPVWRLRFCLNVRSDPERDRERHWETGGAEGGLKAARAKWELRRRRRLSLHSRAAEQSSSSWPSVCPCVRSSALPVLSLRPGPNNRFSAWMRRWGGERREDECLRCLTLSLHYHSTAHDTSQVTNICKHLARICHGKAGLAGDIWFEKLFQLHLIYKHYFQIDF